MTQLGTDIQIILQTQQASGQLTCEGFTGFPSVNPCIIVIATANTPDTLHWAEQLRQALIVSLTALSPALAQILNVDVPCKGTIDHSFRCHAHNVDSAQKLLVLIGDPATPISPSPIFDDWARQGSTYRVLPVFPANTQNIEALLANTSLARRNAVFWRLSIQEAVPAVFSNAGLTTTEHRIFISYSRLDTASLAEQLNDALSHEDFDVYLDRFRTPPTVDFKLRVEQELADKAMVLILESRNLGGSRWCQHEIATARSWRLGLLGLRMPDGIRQVGVRNRICFSRRDFTTPACATLTDAALGHVLDRIKFEHDRKLIYRRWFTRRSFELELLSRGAPPPVYDPDGLMRITSRNHMAQYSVWLTPRTPDLSDFHKTDISLRPSEQGIVIGVGVIEAGRRDRLDWLAEKTAIRYTDEGRLCATAKLAAEGTL